MEFGIIIIIFVVISIISAATSSKKKGQQQQNGDQPQRKTMSDIQKAFMLMSGLDIDEEQQRIPPRPVSAPRPPESNIWGADSEGLSNYGSNLSGSILSNTPIEQEAGYEGNYGAVPSGSTRSDSIIEREAGYKSNFGVAPSGSLSGKTLISQEINKNRVTSGRLNDNGGSTIEHRMDESAEIADIEETNRGITLNEAHRPQPALKLFENKNDYLKAVIYSEILGSGPLAKRSAR